MVDDTVTELSDTSESETSESETSESDTSESDTSESGASAMADASERLRRDGYVVLPARLDDDLVAAARDELGELLSAAAWGTGFDGTRTRRVWAPLAVTRCMDTAALDPLILAVVQRVLGPGAQFGTTCAVQVHPGQGAQVLHFEQNVYPLPRDHDVMLTTIWALDDFTTENGATRVVPASHEAPARKPDSGETIAVQMPAGSVLLFSGRLYHGAGANVSDRPRLGVAIDYIQPWLRPCEAHTLSADPAQVRLLPQRLQELLGFNQPSPYFGFVNGRHPREWLMSRDAGREG
jgi:ectoine hydroxylase-related dioxygenase (phytanoyl-CoA dioxygenase family)